MAIIMGCYYGFYAPQLVFFRLKLHPKIKFYLMKGFVEMLLLNTSVVQSVQQVSSAQLKGNN